MKLIAIIGSPNGIKGNTGCLTTCILETAQNTGAETDIFSLSDLSVQPCLGCTGVCHTNGICNQQDDFEKIKNAMLEADGIIFATPNYNLSVTAQMKAVLDRSCLLLHCQNLKGKYAAFVVTSGGSDPEEVISYLYKIIGLFGLSVVGSIGAVEAQIVDAEERKQLQESAAALGSRMVHAIKSREVFPEQEESLGQSFEIMKYMVIMLKERWPFAWDYWNTHWHMENKF